MIIEKNIPIPERGFSYGRPRLYPFPDMAVGDSFSVPLSRAKLCAAGARKYKKSNPGWDYTARKSETAFRIWRTA